MRKAIITGPTGTIGHALIDACLKEGTEVFAICHPGSQRVKNLPVNESLHIIYADLSQLDLALGRLPSDVDVFYHLGWAGTFGNSRNDMHLQVRNVQYALDAVDLAYKCGCHTFIGVGSQAEYGRFEGKLRPDTPTFPENGYGMAKLCAGEMTRELAHQYGMKHIWTRVLSVYGPYDGEKTMIMSAIRKMLDNEPSSFTKGEQLWDYLYAKDAGCILYALGSEKSVDGKIYCLGSGEARPLKDYILKIRDMIRPTVEPGLGDIPYGPKQVMYLCADTSDLIHDLGYKYRYTFEEGIKETIAWVKETSVNK